MLAVVFLVLTAGCTGSADPPHVRAATATKAAPTERPAPVSSSPAPSDTRSRGDDTAVLTAARAFVRAMLTYSYRRPEQLPPLSRVGDLITRAYAMRLQPRQAVDPELALAVRESSTVRLVSATIARDAPHEAGARYATIAYVQTLAQSDRRESLTRIWQIRLLRFPASGWRVDDVTQAS
ncbi:hypothetical protein [Nonomuraea jabiensis]|uniref:hypothetical protein n=1 Tax=Nonomuraea jabiensis TaxID=882448 RepID=UPI003D744AF9